MVINYDKTEVKKQITEDNIFNLLVEWGGDPQETSLGIIASTICHNPPGEGSRKLYYYNNSNLFYCYSGCANPSFDIFELTIKVMKIQFDLDWDLNTAVRFIAKRFNVQGSEEDNFRLEDWKYLSNYERLDNLESRNINIELPVYDDIILTRFNYKVRLTPWLNENITQEVLDFARIGFYPSEDQITIPHYDINGKFIGLRGRSLNLDDAARFGKYRPIRVNNIQYSHPLGLNLYGLNWGKENIKNIGKAFVLESEKSVLKYMSMFGIDNSIAVACCGSSFSLFQLQLLLDCGVKEVIISFDRQFKEIGDDEFKLLVNKLKKINERYSKYTNVSFIFDKKMITDYKDAPIDKDKDTFLQLYEERIIL